MLFLKNNALLFGRYPILGIFWKGGIGRYFVPYPAILKTQSHGKAREMAIGWGSCTAHWKKSPVIHVPLSDRQLNKGAFCGDLSCTHECLTLLLVTWRNGIFEANLEFKIILTNQRIGLIKTCCNSIREVHNQSLQRNVFLWRSNLGRADITQILESRMYSNSK